MAQAWSRDIMSAAFPENLANLHRGEEEIRAHSIAFLQPSEKLCAHLSMIHSAMDLIDYFCRQRRHEHDDQLTIQLLGIRLFNGAASVLKLCLSGYYQTAALQARDLLETAFLLNLLTADAALITVWRADSNDARCWPVRVRMTLDDRDGFKERKRGQAYKVLCELAGHPNEMGFRLLTGKAGGDAYGPFFTADCPHGRARKASRAGRWCLHKFL